MGITENNGCFYLYQGGCHQFVGLGPTTTEEVRAGGRPKGWCWSCWKTVKIDMLESELNASQSRVDNKSNQKRMRDIMEITNHNAPGIYEPSTIEAINYIACTALGVPTVPAHDWSHNKPRHALAAEALEKLSGNLSHDNVAAAKQILKKILG